MVRFSVIALLVVGLFPLAGQAAKKLSADQILDKVETSLHSADEVANVDMEITEKNGKSKNRKLVIKKKNKGAKQHVLVRLENPTDIKGIGLLSVTTPGQEDQWLYLPSKKKSRRIISSNKKDSFLGSEFSYEDFAPSTYKKFTNKVTKTVKVKGKDSYLIESTAKSKDAAYGKILTWVSKNDFRILKSEYYDSKQKKLKTMDFQNYKKFGNKTWRAKKIMVQNVQNKRGTTLLLSSLKLDSGLKDTEFTKTALERY